MWVFNSATNKWQSLGGGDVSGGDHGTLVGLGPPNDDHPQYHNDARGDVRYAAISHLHEPIYLRPEKVFTDSTMSVVNHGDGSITLSAVGGGTGGTGGIDEVQVSTMEPTAPDVELWVDTDADGTFRTVLNPNAPLSHHELLNLTVGDDHTQYVKKAGDTMTGGLALTGAIGVSHAPSTGIALITAESVDSTAYLEIRAPAGKGQGLLLATGASSRWLIGNDSVAEAGGNTGTNFTITRYSDLGTPIGTVLTINRATGRISVAQAPVDPVDVSTKGYTDAKVENSITGATPQTVAPSQEAVKAYFDSKMVVSAFEAPPGGGGFAPQTVWIEY